MRLTRIAQLWALSRKLEVPEDQPWTIDALIVRAEDLLGEKIETISVPASAVAGVCGGRARVNNTNTLLIPESTGNDITAAGVDTEIVAAHEIAHVVCGHTALSSANAAAVVDNLREDWPTLPDAFVDLPVDDVQAQRDEREAEYLSALILRKATAPSSVGAAVQRYLDSRAHRLAGLFGGGTEDAQHRR